MRWIPALTLLASACNAPGYPAKDSAETGNEAASAPGAVTKAPAPDFTSLTGLWEGGQPATPNQLCMVETAPGTARFGLVVWGGNLHSCSGEGDARRLGGRLLLTMAGDSKCEIVATISDSAIAFPTSVPDGCAYYCGARATLTGARFAARGSGPDSARKAIDLAGDPLC